MKNGKTKAIALRHFYQGKPPPEQVSLLNSLAEAILTATGLKKMARARLSDDLFNAQSESYIQSLHVMCNEVVDGGVKGLATALKVCCAPKSNKTGKQ